MDNRRFELNSPNVIGEVIEGEVMIIDLVGGTYYSLAGTSAVAWPLLAGGVALPDIADAVSRSCGIDTAIVATDLDVFIDTLRAESILRYAAANAGPAATVPPLPNAPYTGFAVARYDDMRALLVVDPVHEVGDFGWPQPPETTPPRTPQ